VYLHIGANDTRGKLPNGTEINKVELQQQSFRELTAANVTAEQCIPQPYLLTQDTLGGVCAWSAADRATMWQYLVANQWVDASGTVLQTHNVNDLLDAIHAAGVPGDMQAAFNLQDVLRMGNAGHAFAIGCMEHEMDFLKSAISA